MNPLKVSVMILTYHHEQFIAQALDSVLEQQVDFPYEIVVSDDASQDSTSLILKDYQQRHPDKIRLLLQAENLGPYENFFHTFFRCQGQYIAYLEGDDYWTCLDKLQKQVDFLDAHPECTLCFHQIKMISEENQWEPRIYPNNLKEVSTLEDLLFVNYIPSGSILYRRGVVSEVPLWMSKLKMSDWTLSLLYAHQGGLGYIGEIMGVYRIHATGTWSRLDNTTKLSAIIKMLEFVNIHFDYQYESIVNESIAVYQQQLIEAAQMPILQSCEELEATYQLEFLQAQLHIQQLEADLDRSSILLAQVQNELAQAQAHLLQMQPELQD
jgi:glycosyltransferase involved in cell wall biosynthesis